jgi:hypothetical protein
MFIFGSKAGNGKIPGNMNELRESSVFPNLKQQRGKASAQSQENLNHDGIF